MENLKNSAFKVKTGSVADVSDYYPEPGAITFNRADGKMYYGERAGWLQQGTPSVPIRMFIEFDGVTQFTFVFRLPLANSLTIHDGDGTVTVVPGNDAVNVTHVTAYTTPGVYYFYVEGDYKLMTRLDINNQAALKQLIVTDWSELVNLTYIRANTSTIYGNIEGFENIAGLQFLLLPTTSVEGDVTNFKNLTSLIQIRLNNTKVVGDVSGWSALTSLNTLVIAESNLRGDVSSWSALTSLISLIVQDTNVSGDVSSLSALNVNNLQFGNTKVTGDISGFHVMTILSFLWFYGCKIRFSTANAWSFDSGFGNEILLQNCGLKANEVDNVLLSFAAGTNNNFDLNLGGNNEKRTSASDAAKATLLGRGWNITVNE